MNFNSTQSSNHCISVATTDSPTHQSCVHFSCNELVLWYSLVSRIFELYGGIGMMGRTSRSLVGAFFGEKKKEGAREEREKGEGVERKDKRSSSALSLRPRPPTLRHDDGHKIHLASGIAIHKRLHRICIQTKRKESRLLCREEDQRRRRICVAAAV